MAWNLFYSNIYSDSSWTDEATIRSDIAATLDWSDDDIWDSMDIESLNPECASAVDVGELQTNSVEVSLIIYEMSVLYLICS